MSNIHIKGCQSMLDSSSQPPLDSKWFVSIIFQVESPDHMIWAVNVIDITLVTVIDLNGQWLGRLGLTLQLLQGG